MEIFNECNEEFNYTEEQKDLFEAMTEGKVIAKINFIGRVSKKKI